MGSSPTAALPEPDTASQDPRSSYAISDKTRRGLVQRHITVRAAKTAAEHACMVSSSEEFGLAQVQVVSGTNMNYVLKAAEIYKHHSLGRYLPQLQELMALYVEDRVARELFHMPAANIPRAFLLVASIDWFDLTNDLAALRDMLASAITLYEDD